MRLPLVSRTRTPVALPFLVFVDLDGTLVGDVHLFGSLADAHRLASRLMEADGKGHKMPPLDFGPALTHHPLLRPGFADFYKGVRKACPTAEFFAYTCGVQDWANTLVPQIEKHLGVAFNHPPFGREGACLWVLTPGRSNYARKSMNAVTARACKALATKYPALRGKSDSELVELMAGRTLLIDDTPHPLCKARQVVCPVYGSTCHFDITRHLPTEALAYPEVRDLVKSEYIDYFSSNYQACEMTRVTSATGELMHVVQVMSNPSKPDTFWPQLQASLAPALKASRGLLTDANVAKINKAVSTAAPV